MTKYFKPKKEFNYCTWYKDSLRASRKVEDKKLARVVNPRVKK